MRSVLPVNQILFKSFGKMNRVFKIKTILAAIFLMFRGPNILGIPPQEASERLSIFQCRFDTLWRKFNSLSAGEELFGMTKTEYPALLKIKKELNLLSKLYSLYNAVRFCWTITF